MAIDAGGVLFHKNQGGDQTDRPRGPIVGANEWVAKLKHEGHKLILVSFAGRKTASITLSDLEIHYPNLFDKVYIVKNKTEKIALCRYLGADVMIDDTIEVHHYIKHGLYVNKPKVIHGLPTVKRILFTGDEDDPQALQSCPDESEDPCFDVTADNWEKVYQACAHLPHTHVPDETIKVSKYTYPEFTK